MQRIRAITLDLDDTLWEIGPVIRRAESEVWQWFDASCPRIADHYTPESAFALRQSLVSEHPAHAHDYSFLRRKALATMMQTAGYEHSDAVAAYDVFEQWRNTVDLFDDVLPALERLKSRYTVLAVTNGNASLERIGIGEYFDGFVNAAGAGAAKPDAPIFEAAVAKAGVPADEVLHVGDHPEFDVAGAAAAGLRTAWMNRLAVTWPEELPRPDAEVPDLLHLDALLDAAAGRA